MALYPSDVPDDLKERRKKIQKFIKKNFGSQRAFCRAVDLRAARVSKALQNRYISNRRLLPLEHAITNWKRSQGETDRADDVTIPVYYLDDSELHPRGERSPIPHRTVPNEIDWSRLVYVEVTFSHHTIIEMINASGVRITDVQPPGDSTTVEYAAQIGQQWGYVTLRFDADGKATLAGGHDASDVLLFGRAVLTLHPRMQS